MLLNLKLTVCSLAALLAVLLLPIAAPAIELTPFATSNQSPLIQIYGLPLAEPATLLESGQFSARLSLNVANNLTNPDNGREAVLFDGETYRSDLALRYGVNERFEAGFDLPYISHCGGFLDGFIENWHSTFHLPNGDREQYPRDRLTYRYQRNGRTLVDLTDSSKGFGDLRLSAAWQLVREAGVKPGAAALRLSLKLPTGDSDKLLGSGSIDLALSLNSQREFPAEMGRVAVYASLGTLVMTDGDVLKDQRRNLAAFGSLGFGWAANNWLALKLQLDGNTSMYKDSNLVEIDSGSLQLVMGGALQLAERTTLDLAVSEDIEVHTAPDVVFHLSLRKVF